MKQVKMTKEELAAGKTIKMPKAKLKNWLKALRSGKYKQARGTLFDENSGGFCCLGVEQACNNKGHVEGCHGGYDSMPSLSYLKKAGILYLSGNGETALAPFLPSLGKSAAYANDDGKKFTTIANAIEKCAVGY